MKKYLVVVLVFAASCIQAQKTAPHKAGVERSGAHNSTIVLKSLNDSFSYAIGLNIAEFYSKQGVTNINSNLIAKAIADVYGNKPHMMTEDQANETVMKRLNPNLYKNIEKGESFLASNKSKPGIKVTASGLQYEIITEGKGPKPGPTDTVVANYKGTLLDGTEFDNSYKRNEPLSIPLNRVITGWTEGLQLMPVGSKFRLYIPYKLAYGLNDNGPIPGGSVLVFELELLSIKGKS